MKCPKCKTDLKDLFVEMGRKGGKKTSPAKTAAAKRAIAIRWERRKDKTK
jgi:hypothetical protein